MTDGPIWKRLIAFSIPLLIGNIFQQMYNTVDSIVVGNYVGKEALAAVGSVDPVINSFIGFFMGLSTGATVVISQYFGAKDDENVSRTVCTTIALTALGGVFCTAFALFCVPWVLRFMAVPEDVMPESTRYLSIYFSGVSAVMFYNMGSGILRAVGDSRRPLYFLIFSTLTNIALDLLFVAKFEWGVAGVAYATIISQALSALLVLGVLTFEDAPYRIRWNRLSLDLDMVRRIVRIGLPGGIQMSLVSFSNVFVHSYINKFGSSAMAGWSSYQKIDKVCMLSAQTLNLSATTFVGQNIGAGLYDRARRGTTVALYISICIAVPTIALTVLFAPELVGLFNRDPEVLKYGTMLVRTMMPFFIAVGFNQIYGGSLRGAGNSRPPVIISMCSFVFFRQLYLYVVSRLTDSLLFVALGYPAGWIVCSIAMYIYFRSVDIAKYKVT